MKIAEWLKSNTVRLVEAGVPTARLDCMVLLADCLNISKASVLAHPEKVLSREHLDFLDKQVKQRINHIPLAYLRGRTEFYGREFILTSDVLEPRPESETIIEQINQLKPDEKTSIIDVGTGSGALAVTAKLEFPKAKVLASDIDKSCISVATKNAAKHDALVAFKHGDLLTPFLKGNYSKVIILANLPYVPDDHKLNQAAMNEPKLAIFGGIDGLDLYRQMFKQLHSMYATKLTIITESLPFQHESLQKIAEESGFKLQKTDDFIQVFTGLGQPPA